MDFSKEIIVLPAELLLVALLIVALLLLLFVLGKSVGSFQAKKQWNAQVHTLRKEIANSSRSVIRGQVSEQLAPYLPNFPFDPAHCKFIGSPIDFLVFDKLEEPEKCAIVLVEVKTGVATLNKNERTVRDAIKAGRVYYYEYRFNGAD